MMMMMMMACLKTMCLNFTKFSIHITVAGPPRTTVQYVMYFQCCGCREVWT